MVISRPQTPFGRDTRSVTPVIGTILIVAIAIVIAAAFGTLAFGFTDKLSGTTVAAEDDQCVNSVAFDPRDVSDFANKQNLDCVVWYDASQLSYSQGDTVDRWPDAGPNGFDMTDSNDPGVTNPSYDGNIEGVPAVKFTSLDLEGLSTEINSSQTDIVQDTTISVTTLVRAEKNESTIFQTGNPDDAFDYFRFGYNDQPPYGSTTTPWFVFAGVDEDGNAIIDGHTPPQSGSINQWRVVTHIHDGSEFTSYVDGKQKYQTASRMNISDGKMQLGYELTAAGGTGAFMEGHISELIVFEKGLSADERKAVECAIDRKHGDAVSVDGC